MNILLLVCHMRWGTVSVAISLAHLAVCDMLGQRTLAIRFRESVEKGKSGMRGGSVTHVKVVSVVSL